MIANITSLCNFVGTLILLVIICQSLKIFQIKNTQKQVLQSFSPLSRKAWYIIRLPCSLESDSLILRRLVLPPLKYMFLVFEHLHGFLKYCNHESLQGCIICCAPSANHKTYSRSFAFLTHY